MMELNTAWEFGSALGLGVLIGLERQRTLGESASFAGVRTFLAGGAVWRRLGIRQ